MRGYNSSVKTLTVRLLEELVVEIEAESRARKLSKSDVVRERLASRPRSPRRRASLDSIRDLVGSERSASSRRVPSPRPGRMILAGARNYVRYKETYR